MVFGDSLAGFVARGYERVPNCENERPEPREGAVSAKSLICILNLRFQPNTGSEWAKRVALLAEAVTLKLRFSLL